MVFLEAYFVGFIETIAQFFGGVRVTATEGCGRE